MSGSERKAFEEKIEKQDQRIELLEDKLEKALAENERLRKELEEALRSLKRQAAPFSKNQPKTDPKAPGRKPGHQYGVRGSRPVPTRLNEIHHAPLPKGCLHCGGRVEYRETKPQFQEEIVRTTIVRRFNVEIGQCCQCGRHVQGRHPLQTSDALGAANVQLGPEALTLSAHLNKEMGLSHERVARILKWSYGLEMSRSGICRAMERIGRQAAATYQQLCVMVRRSDLVWIDETGWRVAAHLQWLWAAVTDKFTVYQILPGRGFAQAAQILGANYAGFLNHDGLRLYYGFLKAFHQSCLAHLLRRCRDMMKTLSGAARRFPLNVQTLLHKALDLRDRLRNGEISPHGMAVATGRIESSLDRLLKRRLSEPDNRRFAKHLVHEQPWIFSFLHCPGLDATNNVAERAIRPAVVARHTWGGNRTANGAVTQQILMSVLRTYAQQQKDSFAGFIQLLRSRALQTLDIIPASSSP
jgi:transposase